jgi:hypothetical protein
MQASRCGVGQRQLCRRESLPEVRRDSYVLPRPLFLADGYWQGHDKQGFDLYI